MPLYEGLDALIQFVNWIIPRSIAFLIKTNCVAVVSGKIIDLLQPSKITNFCEFISYPL